MSGPYPGRGSNLTLTLALTLSQTITMALNLHLNLPQPNLVGPTVFFDMINTCDSHLAAVLL